MKLRLILAAIILVICGFIAVNYYSYIFTRTVHGEIVAVERVAPANAIIGTATNGVIPAQYFSFAVAIRDVKTQEIVTASAEDRQWAVAEKGKCAEAKYYPYPPWHLEKAGTYFNARLLKLYDCPPATETTK